MGLQHLYQTVYMFGGGFDSTSLLILECMQDQRKLVHALHVDYGQKACKGEREVLDLLCNTFPNLKGHTVEFPFFGRNNHSLLIKGTPSEPGSPEKYVMEGRNFMLATLGTRFSNRVAFAFPDERENKPHPPDVTEAWCQSTSRVLSREFKAEISVFSPCVDLQKEELVMLAYDAAPKLVEQVYNCYEEKPCKKCSRCKWKKDILSDLKLLGKTGR